MSAPASAGALTADLTLQLRDEAATQTFGESLALALRPGELVALSGDLGAGKSTLARATIRALAGEPELDVPSPTYTLVQAYDTTPPVAHFDLYRLGASEELDELGFDEALAEGIVLCEWPERAESATANAALAIALSMAPGGGRKASITGAPDVVSRLVRSIAIRAFLDGADHPVTQRRRLFGDASPRRYETVSYGGTLAILMDAPRQPPGRPVRGGLPYTRIAHIAEDVVPFVAVATALRDEGFAAPAIHRADLDAGLLLIEHLGEETMLDAAGRPIAARYEATALALAELHAVSWPQPFPVKAGPVGAGPVGESLVHEVPPFDRGAMGIEVELLLDWYVPRARGTPASPSERASFTAVWSDLFDVLREAETSLVLRDVHSPNVIWRGERQGRDRVGLIDIQDAMIGPSAYDLASLAQDARVDIAPELEARLVAAYSARRRAESGFDGFAFERDYAIMAAQRASKILGIFVRLDERDGKPQYLRHIPRLKTYLRRTLGHPALAALQALYDDWRLLDEGAAIGSPPRADAKV